jgi:hypothetical protein
MRSTAQQLLSDLASQDITVLSDGALSEDICEIRGIIDRLEFEFSRRVSVFGKRRGFVAEGFVSLISWLRCVGRLTPGAAAHRAELAENLGSLPQTSEAFANGEIGYHHAATIAHSVTEIGADAVVAQEPTLVEAARNLDPKHLGFVTRHLRHCADPDGALRDFNELHDRRYLSLSQTWQGLFVIDGRLDPEGGAALRAALNALEEPWQGDVPISAGQRRADALVELARQRLDKGDLPDVGSQKPHLTVTAAASTLAREPGAPAGELDWSYPVPADTVRRLACDCAHTRVLLGPNSEPVDVGRTTRTVPPALRRALVVRDRHCRFPGCDRPPDWCDGHHLIHWADGGETSLENTCLLCRRHHVKVHEQGWQLR